MANKNVISFEDAEVKVRDRRAVRAALMEVKDAHPEGLLTAEDTVHAAENDPRLHDSFVWDDTIAGHRYRLVQARALITTIMVTMPDDPAENQVPKFVSLKIDRSKPGGGYREVREVINSDELRAELERTLKADVQGVLKRYEVLTDLVTRVRRALGIGKPAKKDRKTKNE